jgi:hypothetical protein
MSGRQNAALLSEHEHGGGGLNRIAIGQMTVGVNHNGEATVVEVNGTDLLDHPWQLTPLKT